MKRTHSYWVSQEGVDMHMRIAAITSILAWHLDPITGVLTLNTSVFLDFERIQIYMLNVSAEDLGQPSNTAFVQVVIEIIVRSLQPMSHSLTFVFWFY